MGEGVRISYAPDMERPAGAAALVTLLLLTFSFVGCASSAQRESGTQWSTRNTRVAVARHAGDPPLVYFARGEMPATPGVNIVVGLSRDEALARAGEAHGADVFYATSEFLRAATNLRWVQAGSAGVDRFLSVPELGERDEVVLTNARSVHGPVIAEHAFAMLLSLTRGLNEARDAQRDGRWARESAHDRVALEGRTMLVVGLGGIGGEIAKRAHGFGMRVIATRRGTDPAPAYVERVGRPNDLLGMLPEADIVAIAVPLTRETEGLFDQRAFAAMKKGSYLLNIARGKVVKTEALIAALRDGTLAGAGLDVTDPEPLPPGHDLWSLPNVVITAHVAGDAALTEQRASQLAWENLRRFGAGEPLVNVVDKRAGY
jgi:phosphoglycerate dehydrogenase-like enzyme